jgi:hypothetical protein
MPARCGNANSSKTGSQVTAAAAAVILMAVRRSSSSWHQQLTGNAFTRQVGLQFAAQHKSSWWL